MAYAETKPLESSSTTSAALQPAQSLPAISSSPNVWVGKALRVEISDKDGSIHMTDRRNQRVWQQVRVETEEALRQRIVGFDAARGEWTLECGMAGVRPDGKRGVASARITLRVSGEQPDIELTVQLDPKEGWRQVAYPYVFVRDGARVSNLFPHCEGMLVPVRKSDPDWLELPDGGFFRGSPLLPDVPWAGG